MIALATVVLPHPGLAGEGQHLTPRSWRLTPSTALDSTFLAAEALEHTDAALEVTCRSSTSMTASLSPA